MNSNKIQNKNNRKILALKIIFRVLFMFIILGLFFFFTAGSIHYWEAWVYCLTLLVPASFVLADLLINDPDLLERRVLKRKEKEREQKSIQKVFTILFFIGLLIPGFDYRYNWSEVHIYIVIAADLLVLFGYLVLVRVLKENRFASAIIETTDEQKVIETGPYRLVRHPMYTGGIFMLLFTPIALGSYWALIPFLIGTIMGIVLRIKGEENYLEANLPGYREYCKKTKYRLLPFIW